MTRHFVDYVHLLCIHSLLGPQILAPAFWANWSLLRVPKPKALPKLFACKIAGGPEKKKKRVLPELLVDPSLAVAQNYTIGFGQTAGFGTHVSTCQGNPCWESGFLSHGQIAPGKNGPRVHPVEFPGFEPQP